MVTASPASSSGAGLVRDRGVVANALEAHMLIGPRKQIGVVVRIGTESSGFVQKWPTRVSWLHQRNQLTPTGVAC